MRFLNRIIGSGVKNPCNPCARQRRRSALPRGSRIEIESLESRNLLSIGGVTLSYGELSIVAPLLSGNKAAVSIDPTNQDVKVSLNGQSEEFCA